MAELVDALDLKKVFKEYSPDCHSQTEIMLRKLFKGRNEYFGRKLKSKNGLNGEGDPPKTNDQ